MHPEVIDFFVFFSFDAFHKILRDAGHNVSAGWLSGLIKSWGYSFKKVEYRQMNKFTDENMRYYATFIESMQHIPYKRLKFLDESHFKSKGKQRSA
jgi:hypothetical protein